MKKLILLLCTLGTFCVSAYGQARNIQDVIYLENGSIIKGTIVEQVPNKSIKVMTKDGSVFVYNLEDVSRITKEVRNKDKNKGYFGNVAFTYGVGVGNGDGINRIGLSVINGYRFNRHLAVGGGIGVMNILKTDEWMLPLFAHFHTCFLKDETTPFFSANMGFNVSVMSGFMNGFFFAPELGVLIKGKVTLSVGYQIDRVRYYLLYNSGLVTKGSEWAGAINLKLGVTF